MTQILITIVIVGIAAYFIVKKTIDTIRYFRKPRPCRGCNGSCGTCPIVEFPHAGKKHKQSLPRKEKHKDKSEIKNTDFKPTNKT